MDAISKAKELGSLIGSSDEMTNYKAAEAAIENDEKSRILLNDLKLLQTEMVNAARDNKEKKVLNEIKANLQAKQEEIDNYTVTKNFFHAKLKFDNFMKQINDVIIYGITGEEPCSPGKCSTCEGGCK